MPMVLVDVRVNAMFMSVGMDCIALVVELG